MRQCTALPGTPVCANPINATAPQTHSRFRRRLTTLLGVLLLTLGAGAQSTANYVFSTATNGSLADMSSGTTQLLGTGQDDAQSSVTNLPFDFWFMGTRYTQFSINSNGLLRLGGTGVGTTGNTQIGSVASTPLISAFSLDVATSGSGKIHYKVTGSAPNRVLVIEWLNMQIGWNSGTADGTWQVWLGEDGTIRFVYGSMAYNYVPGTTTVSAGFQSSNTANTYATVNIGTNAVTTTGGTTNYNLGSTAPATIPVSSTTDGNRRVYLFTPTAPPAAPTNLVFSNVTALGMTLGWTAPSPLGNTTGYAVYVSTDNTNYSYVTTTPAATTTYTATGLTPATNYFWKIYAVGEGSFSTALLGVNPTSIPGSFVSTATGGLWSQPATWASGTVPAAGDDVTIADGATVIIDVNPIVNNLTVGQGTSGTLVYNPSAAQSLTVTQDLTIASGASFRAAATGSTSTITTHTLSIAGSLVNNGSIDFASTAGTGGTVVNAARVAVTFTGTTNTNFDLSNGTMANFAGVTVNKGTSNTATLTFSAPANFQSTASSASSGTTINVVSTAGLAVGMTVSVQSGTGAFAAGTTVTAVNNGTQFTVSAAPTTALAANASVIGSTVTNLSAATPGFLTLTNGTFVAGGTQAYKLPLFATAAYTIPATAGLTINNANAVITGLNGSPTLNGKLTMTTGTYNVGVVAGNEMGAGATANFLMNGGTINFASRFNTANALTFNMSGGTINVTTVGNATSSSAGFGMTSTTANVTISGGTINLVQASTGTTQRDYYVAASNPTITGGTLNVGTSATATNFTFVIMGAMPNVVIDNTGNNKTAKLSSTSPAVAYGTVLVNSGTTLNLNGTSMTVRGTTLTNDGTINGSATGSRLSFLSTGAQTFAGSGGLTSPLDGLIVRTGGGLTISHTNGFNTLRVELQYGTIINSNKITLGTGAAAAVTVQTGYSGNTGVGGFFDVAPLFNLGTGTYTISAQQESALRTLNLEIPASRSIGALIVNNSNGVTFNGALSSGALTLTSGTLNTSATNLLTVTGTTTGSVSGGSATSYVNGPLQRTLPASLATGSTYSFPVGKSGYNPLDLVNPVTTAGGTVVIRAEAFDGNAGGTAGSAFGSLSTTRYWEVQVPSGNANLTSSLIRLNDTRGSFDAIGSSSTQTGTYTLVGGAAPTLATGSITSVAPSITNLAGFYLMALKSPPVLNNLTINPSAVSCGLSVPHTVTVDVTGGTAPYTAVLSYTVNGGAAQTVPMTLSGSTFSGTIPAVTPANATVAWSVTVTDANTLTASLTGTPYRDAPLSGVVPVLQASPTTVCAGQPVTLTANPSFEERFETVPITTFAATSPITATQNSTYYSEGTHSMLLTYTANNDAAYTMTQNFNLTGYTGAQLTFSHQAILEGSINSYDYGYVQYSTNGGSTWTSFPTSSYAGSGTLFNGVVSFSDRSYSDWTAAYTGSGSLPNNTLWKNETINIPAAALTSQFRIRFRITSDGSLSYYGWLIDNVRIGLPSSSPYVGYLWQDGTTTTTNTYTYVPTANDNAAVIALDANGCNSDISNLVPITVNPLPAAPTATNSTQCGLAVPTASVSSNNSGFATHTFKWYDAATGGNLVQTGTSATYTTALSATTTFYVSEVNPTTSCESPRVAVTVNVNTPDPISATSSVNNVCPGTPITLSAQQTGSTQHYTYTWTAAPATGSGIATSVTGASVSVTPTTGGTFVYTLTGVDGTCTATNTVSVTIIAPPAITSVTATTPVCPGATITLAAQSVPAGPSTVALGTSTATNISSTSLAAAYPTWFGNGRQQYLVLASELQGLGLVAGNLTSLAFDVVTASGDPATLNGYTIKLRQVPAANNTLTAIDAGTFTTVWGPQNYTPVVGVNTHTFSTPFAWDGTSNIVVDICFSNGVTGNGSAQTKQTNTSFASTVYYAADGTGGTGACTATSVTGSGSVRPNMIFGGIAGVNVTANYTWTWNPGNLPGPTATTTAPANNTGAAITQTYTVTATDNGTGCSSSSTVNVTVNFTPGTPTATNSNQCGLAVPTASVTSTSGIATPTFNWYDAATGGTVLQTGTSNTYTTAINSTTTFYVSEINAATGCESARVPVTVTVAAPDPITASTGAAVCPNTAATLSVTQTGNTQHYTYTWTANPVAGSGIPTSVTGASVSVTPTASGTYTYTVTGVDGSCTASSTVSLTVKPSPAVTTITATPTTVCPGGSVALAATSVGIGNGPVTIGAGALTSTSYQSPFYHLYGGMKQQTLFRASELLAAGLTAGNITGIKLDIVTGGMTYANFAVSIGSTNLTALTTTMPSGLTNVFNAVSYTPTSNSLNTITFATPFNWDGVSNIILQTCWSNNNGGGTNNTVHYDNTSFVALAYYRADNTSAAGICGATTATSTLSARPKVVFLGQTMSNITTTYSWVWNPGNLTGASVTATAPANNTGAPLTQTYTVTATDANNGCTTNATVDVTVNPTPAAPTATNSTQCGFGVPAASVASNTGVATPSFSWYAAATGGTALQTGTQTTYQTAVNATTTFYVSEVNTTTGCESARVPVTVTVNQPDAIDAVANLSAVCANGALNLSATQTGNTQNYTYTWTATPAAGSGIATSVSGASVTVTPSTSGSFLYTVTGVSGQCTTFDTVRVTVNANPQITAVTGPTTAVCPGASVALSAQSVPAAAGTATLGTATGVNATNTSLAAAYPTWFGNGRQQYLVLASELQARGVVPGNLTSLAFDVTTAGGDPATLNGYTIKLMPTTATSITALQSGTFTTVWGPQNYTPVVGINTHTFTAPFNWDGTSNLIVDICFSNQVTGNGSAQTKQTATSFASTVYYAADGTGGAGACTSTSLTGSGSIRPNMIFGAQIGNVLTGNYTWTWNPGGLTGASVTTTAPANNSGAAVTQVYTVTATNSTTGCSSSATVNVTVNATPGTPTANNSNQCGVAVPTASVTSTSGLANPTFNWYAAATGGTPLQTGTQTTYQTALNTTTTFYVSETNTTTGCESARVPVTVNVTQPDAVDAGANSPICIGSTVNLTATQTGSSNHYTFTWTATPATGSGLAGSVTGASQTITPTAAGNFVYSVTAFDPSGSCTVIDTVRVTVNPNPAITTVSANPTSVCSGSTVTLTAGSIGFGNGPVTIGAGAQTSAGYQSPFYHFYGGMKQQTIFLASELQAAGLTAGAITGLRWDVVDGGISYANFAVSAGTTTLSDLSGGLVTTGLAPVYSAASYTTTANSLNTITFTTPINWDGTSNIILQTCWSNNNSGGTSSTVKYDATSYVSLAYYRADNQDAPTICGATAASGTLSARPKVDFIGRTSTDITASYNWTWNPGNLSGAQVVTPAPTVGGVQTYTVRATNPITGCFAIDSVHVTVGGSFTVNTGSNPATLCGSGTATLTATPSGTGVPYTYVWKDAANNTIGTTATVSVSPTATSVYTVTVTNFCGTSVTQTVTVNVNPIPTVTPSLTAQTVCNGSTAALNFSTTATGGTTTYAWTGTNPAVGLAASGSGNISFTATNSTTAPITDTIRVTPTYTANGTSCTGSSVTATITVNPTPTVNAVTSQTLCSGAATTAVTFAGTVPGTVYNWTNSAPSIGLAASGSGNIASFTATNTGSSAVTATITVTPQFTGGSQVCAGTAQTFTFTVNPLPTGTITAPNGTLICSGIAVPLQVTGGTSYQWFLNGNPISGATGASISATQVGVYTVNITNASGCTAAASNSITIGQVQPPHADFTFNSYCVNTQVQFTNTTTTSASVPVNYQWNFGDGASSTVTDPTHTYTAVGSYPVRLVASYTGCPSLSDTVTKSIAIEAPIAGQRLAPVDVVTNRPTEIHARNLPGGRYSWTPASGLSNPSIWYPVATLTQQQEYRIQVSFNSGCVTMDTLLVRVQPMDDIAVPSAFSPDGDGVNDVLHPITVGIASLRAFVVYDRMGREVFRTSVLTQGWDGTYRGQPLPPDTYIWVAEGRDSNGNLIRKTGQVALLR